MMYVPNPNRDAEEAIAELLEERPDLKAAVEEGEPAYQVAREIIHARGEQGITQAELARRMGTTQSVISRLEAMDTTPNLRTVFAVAKALGRKVELRFVTEAEQRPVDEVADEIVEASARLMNALDALAMRDGRSRYSAALRDRQVGNAERIAEDRRVSRQSGRSVRRRSGSSA